MNQQENSEIINSINEIKNALCNFNQRPNQEEKKYHSHSLFQFPTFSVYGGAHRWMSMFIYRPNINVRCLLWLLAASFLGQVLTTHRSHQI